MIDTHCHLLNFDYPELIWEKATLAGVKGIIIPALNPIEWRKAISFAEAHSNIWCLLGIHPMGVDERKLSDLLVLEELLKHPLVVGIGEIGLDKNYQTDFDLQTLFFREQLKLAKKASLPVVIHQRKSFEEVFKLLKEFKIERVLHHAWTGNKTQLCRWLAADWEIAVGGAVTFPNIKKLKSSIKSLDSLNSLHLETDSPYIKIFLDESSSVSSPEFLIRINRTLADWLKLNSSEVEKVATANSSRFFQLELGL